MSLERAKTTFFFGIGIVLVGATGFVLPALAAPWPHVLLLVGLSLVNAGLFLMGRQVMGENG